MRKNQRRPLRLLTAVSALCAALALGACGNSRSPAGTITLYNGQHEQTTGKLVSAFEMQTGIKVRVRSADEATLGNQIVQEGSNSPADVFYTENTPVLEALAEKGLLAPVASSTIGSVPRRFSSAAGSWVGVTGRESVLVYNTSKLKASEVPSSILELAQPRWKGKLGFAPSETDFQPLITSVIKARGTAAAESWLKGVAANARTYPDNETVVAQVNNGESELGPINHYYWYRLRAELGGSGIHSALHYYAAGDPGNLLNLSGAAVLRSSTHQADAQEFLAFLVSRVGQEVIAHSESFEYPLRPGVEPAKGLRPFAGLDPVSLSPAELGDGSVPLAMEQKLGLL
jgi:iron(III) transport system substrate-binding protein